MIEYVKQNKVLITFALVFGFSLSIGLSSILSFFDPSPIENPNNQIHLPLPEMPTEIHLPPRPLSGDGDGEGQAGEVFCGISGRWLPEEKCRRYAVELKALEVGVAAFAPPREMTVGEIYTLNLAVGPWYMSQEMGELAGSQGALETREIRVSRFMRAHLVGEAFEIEGADANEQKDLGLGLQQIWQWRVSPKHPGTHTLIVIVQVLASDGTPLDAFQTKPIAVRISVPAEESEATRRSENLGTLDYISDFLSRSIFITGAIFALLILLVARVRKLIWTARHNDVEEINQSADEAVASTSETLEKPEDSDPNPSP